ncbi:FecR domain-containing protein [uncultured Chitinophaga sp.]|jgi:Fe2+-dicitrate sensor, membrane component|uniref:FecR family protein n=1 Tax=uncultured Chitinophaga sp. TaxID=339340 RepID=UPI002631DEFF|nr:FecR domain-containing protein [uncultured Chitinophaga sp.]
MKFNPVIIDQLTSQQVAGIISREDEDYLNELLSRDSEALEYWKSMRLYYESMNAPDVQQAFDEHVALMNTWDRIEKSRRSHNIRRILSIAAIGLLAVSTLTYILVPSARTKPETAAVSTAANGIRLTLPGGSTIDLSTEQGQVAVAGATLQHNNKVLRYTPDEGKNAGAFATLTVPIGKDYKLQLADGSEIWLNSATSVQFPFAFGDSREITINGEAYVKVAANADKPFLVHLGNTSIQVLGTEFNVNTYDSGLVKIALVAGSVKLQAAEQSRVIKPGYEAVYTDGATIKTHPFDEDYLLSWRKGIFKFQDISLDEICRVLPRWFGIAVVMDSRQTAGKRFSGELDRNKSLEKQLELFKNATDLDYYFKDGVLHFR